MLALTKKTEYALIALCHLARVGERTVSARDVAEHYRMRLPLLMNVLKTLSHSGLVRSARGALGGYRLAVPAEQITLMRLVEAVEGPVRLVRCVTGRARGPRGHCEMLNTCPLRGPVKKVHERLEEFLDHVSVANLAQDETFDTQAAEYRLKVLSL